MTSFSNTHASGVSQAIDTSVGLFGTDLRSREAAIVAEVVSITQGEFSPGQLLWRSDYFGTGKVGAFHYRGTYQGREVILKIQGAKPAISEAWMISQFAAQNQSTLIRPPQVFWTLRWLDERGYEALILEFVSGQKVISSKKLLEIREIEAFFKVYQEYRQHAIVKPWLPQPIFDLTAEFAKLEKVAGEVKPHNPWRKLGDVTLARQATKVLQKVWSGVETTFQHGHFSLEDLIWQGNQVVVFSNLFWKWKFPFYDAVFGYHWGLYELTAIEGVTAMEIESQRRLWLDALATLPQAQSAEGKKLLKAALLERAIAGLLVDSMAYIDESNPLAEHIVAATRGEVERLMRELENL